MYSSAVSIRYVLIWLVVLTLVYALISLIFLLLSPQLSDTVAAFPAAYLGQFILILTFALALRTARWCYLCGRIIPGVSRRQAAAVYIGGFLMWLTPGRIGEIWRAWVIHQRNHTGYRRALPLLICDRLLDLNVLLLFAMSGLFLAAAAYQLLAAATAVTLIPLLLLLLRPLWCRQIIKFFWRIAEKKWARKFAALLAICRHVNTVVRPAVYLPALLLTLCAWGTEAFAFYHLVMQVKGALSLAAAMATLGLGNIAGVLTFLPGGIGGQEATMIYLLQQNGNSFALAAAITGAVRISAIFYVALLSLPFFIRQTQQAALSAKI